MRKARAFSLLEVVLALAVFAIIVVPAIGLVALSYRNANTDLQAPNAVEIKSLLELELRGVADPDGVGGYAFSSAFLGGGATVVFYASQSLDLIERDESISASNEKYYKVTVTEPVDYVYSDTDAYRVFLFNVVWPAFVPDSGGGFISNEDKAEGLQQLILPVVLSK